MKSQKNASSSKSQKDRHNKVRQRKTNAVQPKKASSKQVIEKVVRVLKPQAQSKQELKLANQREKKSREKLLDVPFAESSAMTTSTKFFYTSDELISNFDDQQLYDIASKQFPGLSATEKNDNVRKNAILAMLNDIEFMNDVLEQYNMTILDFFKFLFRLCPSTFKGMFVRKLQNALKDKPYAQSIKFGNYKYRDQRKRTKRCSIF